MTTKNSSLSAIQAQADKIASTMKAIERGHTSDPRLKGARLKPTFKTGIVMDDKVITIEMSWETIRDTGEAELAAYIAKQMREEVANG